MTTPLFRAPETWQQVQQRQRWEWADRYGLQPSKASHVCLRWIATRGRCRRYCEPMPSSWGDHPSAWVDAQKRPAVLLLQPYNFASGYLQLRRQLDAFPQLFLRFERADGGWHHPATALVEIWRDEDAYNAARK